jgi:hypothetical protein
MPLNAEQRRARARIAANTRWNPGQDDLTAEDEDILGILDRHIDAIVARAPRMSPEQSAKLRRLFSQPATPGGG